MKLFVSNWVLFCSEKKESVLEKQYFSHRIDLKLSILRVFISSFFKFSIVKLCQISGINYVTKMRNKFSLISLQLFTGLACFI